MEKVRGKMVRTLRNAGSKSEGFLARLQAEEGGEWTLYRADHLPYDDSFFLPFADRQVVVEGVKEEGGYLRVERMEPACEVTTKMNNNETTEI